MNWKELLHGAIEYNYGITEKLMDMVEDEKLGWKPETGENWMTTGQVLMHLTNACGAACRGIITGDWGLPEGVDFSDMSPDDMLPPAEKMPSIGSVAEAKKLLAEDKNTALEMLAQCSEDQLNNQDAPVPWDPQPTKLGHRLLQMVQHLSAHKAQLFYYLKLQGKPVNTSHLWGM